MKPKEKAEELINTLKPNMYCYMGSGMLSNDYDDNIAHNNAVDSAVLMVDEIRMLLQGIKNEYYSSDLYNFWADVKFQLKELKK